MMIISFGWTTPALFADPDLGLDPFARCDPALQKTETRRSWKASHAARFHEGDLVQAWDNGPRAGGRRVGTVRLTRELYQERACDIPGNAWFREGFEYMVRIGATRDGFNPREFWWRLKASGELLWVVTFELVEDLRGNGC